MSITDELREWLDTGKVHWLGRRPEIEPMLDRIDAEHESKVSYWQGASYKDGYDEGFASADDYFTDKRETLKEHGWVRLPVDADGVPIRVGDRVQFLGSDPSTVSHMSLASDGWRVYVKYDGDLGTGSGDPNCMRHYTPPTVEDVLREFSCVLMGKQEFDGDVAEAIAEYAAKLQLKEDE